MKTNRWAILCEIISHTPSTNPHENPHSIFISSHSSKSKLPIMSDYYGRIDEETNIYRHYPSFLRLFRYEFDCIMDNMNPVATYRDKLSEYLSSDLSAKLKIKIPLKLIGFNTDEGRDLYRMLTYIPKEKTDFWSWFHKFLIDCSSFHPYPFHCCPLDVTNSAIADKDRLLHMLTHAPEIEKESFDIFFAENGIPNPLDYVAELLMIKPFLEGITHGGASGSKGMEVDEYKDFLRDHVKPKFDAKCE